MNKRSVCAAFALCWAAGIAPAAAAAGHTRPAAVDPAGIELAQLGGGQDRAPQRPALPAQDDRRGITGIPSRPDPVGPAAPGYPSGDALHTPRGAEGVPADMRLGDGTEESLKACAGLPIPERERCIERARTNPRVPDR